MTMVANDENIKHSKMHNNQLDKEDLKVKLKTVRYINKKESVLCISHVDDDVKDEASDGGSVSPVNRTSVSPQHSDSDSDVLMSSDTEAAKKTKGKGRKSVRFMFDDDKENCEFFMDNSSIVSEPVKDPPRRYTYPHHSHTDDISLPPIKKPLHKGGINKDRLKAKWPGKDGTSHVRIFESLNPLGLSPRVTRKMSSQTLNDLQTGVTDIKESLASQSTKPSHDNPQQQQPIIKQRKADTASSHLSVISEKGTLTKSDKLLPRRLEDVYPKLPKVSSSFVASDQETQRLEFIKRALSPMTDTTTAINVMRNRAATISGGEKRSWIMQRRNSKDDIGSWVNTLQNKYKLQVESEPTKPDVSTGNWLPSGELDVI